jgi:hypothetical protein
MFSEGIFAPPSSEKLHEPFRRHHRGMAKVPKTRGIERAIRLALTGAAVALVPLNGVAASTARRSFTVSVMVVSPECTVSATPAKLSPGRGTAAAFAGVSVTCAAAIPYDIGLTDGPAAEGTAVRRSYSLRSSAGATARSIGVGFSEPATNTFSVVEPISVKEDAGDGPTPDTIRVTITY